MPRRRASTACPSWRCPAVGTDKPVEPGRTAPRCRQARRPVRPTPADLHSLHHRLPAHSAHCSAQRGAATGAASISGGRSCLCLHAPQRPPRSARYASEGCRIPAPLPWCLRATPTDAFARADGVLERPAPPRPALQVQRVVYPTPGLLPPLRAHDSALRRARAGCGGEGVFLRLLAQPCARFPAGRELGAPALHGVAARRLK